MSHVCRHDMAGFDQLLKLSPTHADRKDVEDCPRCGSLFLEYQTFMRAGEVAGADEAAAQKHLTTFIEGEAARSLPRSTEPSRAWWKLPAIRWTVPIAAVVVAVAIGVWRMQPDIERASDVRAVQDATTLVLLSAQRIDGALELAWKPVPSADAYDVRLLDAQFAELRRVRSATTTLRLEMTATEGSTYCQVVALDDGDEIAASPLQRLSAPVAR